MIIFRIARREFLTLDGKGAAEYPGRWNQEGIPCLYASNSPSLAQLEVMVNVEDWRFFSVKPHVILEIEIPPENIKIFQVEELPKRWDDPLINPETQDFGTALLKRTEVLGFSVPSAIMKLERNYVLNPKSKHFKDVFIKRVTSFHLDARFI